MLGASLSVGGEGETNHEPDDVITESPVSHTPPPNSITSDVSKADAALRVDVSLKAEVEVTESEADSVAVQVNEPSPPPAVTAADGSEGHSPVRSPYTIAGFTGITCCLVAARRFELPVCS